MAKAKPVDERVEALFRIVVGIVSGIILGVWKMLIQILAVINFLITVITDERNQELADFCEHWNTEMYRFLRYMTFVSNERPFPFTPMQKMSKFE
jgi:sorbitol-specific phosphotransferase system component IIC